MSIEVAISERSSYTCLFVVDTAGVVKKLSSPESTFSVSTLSHETHLPSFRSSSNSTLVLESVYVTCRLKLSRKLESI